MKNGKCSRFFPKKIYPITTISEDGYPYYHRRNNLSTIIKNGISLDNRSIVPYNFVLLVKYQAHINLNGAIKVLLSSTYSNISTRVMAE